MMKTKIGLTVQLNIPSGGMISAQEEAQIYGAVMLC